MTWKDIWKRLWFVLRSRWFPAKTCPECGWLLVRVDNGGGSDGSRFTKLVCEECVQRKCLEDLEQARKAKELEEARRAEVRRLLYQRSQDSWRESTKYATARIV